MFKEESGPSNALETKMLNMELGKRGCLMSYNFATGE